MKASADLSLSTVGGQTAKLGNRGFLALPVCLGAEGKTEVGGAVLAWSRFVTVMYCALWVQSQCEGFDRGIKLQSVGRLYSLPAPRGLTPKLLPFSPPGLFFLARNQPQEFGDGKRGVCVGGEK